MTDTEHDENIEQTITQSENEAPADNHENPSINEEHPVALQAARYNYISHLENLILSEDESVSENDMMDVDNCKAQVLIELVSVAAYTSQLSADNPQKKAADALMKHLYKCYDKTQGMQEKIRAAREKTRYMKDVKQVILEDLPKRYSKQNIVTDDQLLPKNNVINLAGLGLGTGYIAMMEQLINNPRELIKAQMPNLIDELSGKITGSDKKISDTYIGKLLLDLSGYKNEKSMIDALEGKNITGNILALAGGKSL